MVAAVAVAKEEVLPRGELTVDGAGPFVGTLGSNCITSNSVSGCSDTPWLTPSSGPSVRASADMSFHLADGSKITSWSATYGDASQFEPTISALDGQEESSSTAFSFTGPPCGDWVVSVFVRFQSADASGDATYYFRIHAGMPETDPVAPTAPSTEGSDLVALTLLMAALAGGFVGWRLRSTSGARVSR
jgi:hypothetical protein